jgi:alkylation response protein AidB-like acyl-CoA dehydrogenase
MRRSPIQKLFVPQLLEGQAGRRSTDRHSADRTALADMRIATSPMPQNRLATDRSKVHVAKARLEIQKKVAWPGPTRDRAHRKDGQITQNRHEAVALSRLR